MKNSVKRLLALVLTCAMLSVCALAADFTGRADELYELGLFKGTGTDADGRPVYNLEAAPTRAEAVTMLVRLLGKEAEALEGTWEVPFTDLGGANAWALPYVGYAYANKLTNGESDTLFGTNNRCSAQMYCTLVLRALGYSDAAEGDFAYSKALDFAAEKGLLDAYLTQGEFLRDQVAAVSYAALVTPLKGGDTLLVDKLVADGAVKAEAAKALTDKAALYAEYLALNEKINAANKNQSVDMTMNMNMVMNAAGVEVPMTMKMREQMRLVDSQIEMAAVAEVTAMGQVQKIETYVKDGYMYTNDGVNKVKAPFTAAESLPMDQLNQAAASPLYFIDSISKTEADGKTSYTVTLSGSLLTSMTGMLSGVVGQNLDNMTLGNVTMTMIYQGQTLSGMTMHLPMSMTAEGQTIAITADMEATIHAMGDGVVVTFPSDLGTYVEAAAE